MKKLMKEKSEEDGGNGQESEAESRKRIFEELPVPQR